MHAFPAPGTDAPRTDAPESADLEPGSHVMYRFRVHRAPADLSGSAQVAEAFEAAARITRYGGLVLELQRPSSDPEQGIHVAAILTVAQAIEMVFDEVQEEIAAVPPPALLTSASGASRGYPAEDALGSWIHDQEEAARRVGVPRLASLLSSAGVRGDTELAANQLWTACGY